MAWRFSSVGGSTISRDSLENAPECGQIRGANITPDEETGIGGWSRDDFIARFTALAPRDHAEIAVAAGEANCAACRQAAPRRGAAPRGGVMGR